MALQKRAIKIITFFNFYSHSTSLFKNLAILKFVDLIYLDIALFMHDFHSKVLPTSFCNFFKSVKEVHQYNTRFASKHSYCIPKAKTNYGKFNIRLLDLKDGILFKMIQNSKGVLLLNTILNLLLFLSSESSTYILSLLL